MATLLTGCTSTSDLIEQKKGDPEIITTPAEARAEVHSLLENASNVIGGNWHIEESPLPEQCDVISHSDGVYWSGGRRQEGLTDIEGPTNRILHYWQSQGFALETNSYAAEHRAITARAPGGVTLYYGLDLGVILLDVDGRCVRGDWYTIREDIASTLPDPYEKQYGTPSSVPPSEPLPHPAEPS
ncbi:hypothetical protein [Leifsonia sp. ALI-44-B]|uniref:hypothetical protein n=1 Tax=Leifsonia sp. ALI-44-B TaxID=1933776 RepID=UPI0015C36D65|nr:hypothetical protein [Leifsonia sp. ALI-44-B]